MADQKQGNEPQSYGSEAEWVTGKTGEKVNRDGGVPAEHADFYDDRRESETNTAHQGGHISPTDLADNAAAAATSARAVEDDQQPSTKISAEHEGAPRGNSFFKNRDYPSS